ARALRFESLQAYLTWKVSQPIDAGDARQQLGRAVLLARIGRFAEAADSLERGLTLDGHDAEMWALLATIRLDRADEPGYRQAWRQMRAQLGDDAPPATAWVLVKIALLRPPQADELALVRA